MARCARVIPLATGLAVATVRAAVRQVVEALVAAMTQAANNQVVGRAAGGKIGPPGEPADHPLSRGWEFFSKAHLVTAGSGGPAAVLVTAGQVHGSRVLEAAVGAVRKHRRVGARHEKLAASTRP